MPSAVAHEHILQAKYEFSSDLVRSSTQISSRASAIISRLGAANSQSAANDVKSTVVALQASARAANKLISIMEIVKRELKRQNTSVFQYTALSSELIEVKPKPLLSHAGTEDDAVDGEDDAFEVMERSITEKRQSPVLTIYLSNSSIPELRSVYSEQED